MNKQTTGLIGDVIESLLYDEEQYFTPKGRELITEFQSAYLKGEIEHAGSILALLKQERNGLLEYLEKLIDEDQETSCEEQPEEGMHVVYLKMESLFKSALNGLNNSFYR